MTHVTHRFHKVITTWNLAAQYKLIMLTLVTLRSNSIYQKGKFSQAINHFTYYSKEYVPKQWRVPNLK
jgi:hypothetical protein